MKILSASDLSRDLRSRLKTRLKDHRVGLTVVRVGDDPASQVYVANKIRACAEVGLHGQEVHLPATTSSDVLKTALVNLNENPNVHGILLQLPLPAGLAKNVGLDATDWISPAKDADGLTSINQGRLHQGRPHDGPALAVRPCTPAGIIELLKFYEVPLRGVEVVIVGRSSIVGRPAAELFLREDATVTVAHSQSKDLAQICRRADVLVVAAGKMGLIGREHVKKGAVIVDVGIHRGPDGKLCGDVRQSEIADLASACTPVPGGVGPMTITMLLQNTVDLYFAAQSQRSTSPQGNRI
jgi:methylenetetrahydrofolate dehydrogenase (NADP+) / methenyltetrahydrofolate cyclohydrolase